MLRTTLIHPIILRRLGESGHGSQILIADGNYPVSTHAAPGAERVYLNLRPGLLRVTDIFEALVPAIPIEAVTLMQTATGETPPIAAEAQRLAPGVALRAVERFAFYALARQPEVALVIASADERLAANILLTIGVVAPTEEKN